MQKRFNRKRMDAVQMTVGAFCAALNIAGAYIALCLKLPIYMDNIGTILAGALLGPGYGIAAALGSGIISGMTTDIYAIYFMPDGMLTGMMAGFLFRTPLFKTDGPGAAKTKADTLGGRITRMLPGSWRFPVGVAVMAGPGTIAAAVISACVFSGVTSSGSGILVQVLSHLGCDMVISAFIVQIFTNYADRFISLSLVMILLSYMTGEMRRRLVKERYYGKI